MDEHTSVTQAEQTFVLDRGYAQHVKYLYASSVNMFKDKIDNYLRVRVIHK